VFSTTLLTAALGGILLVAPAAPALAQSDSSSDDILTSTYQCSYGVGDQNSALIGNGSMLPAAIICNISLANGRVLGQEVYDFYFIHGDPTADADHDPRAPEVDHLMSDGGTRAVPATPSTDPNWDWTWKEVKLDCAVKFNEANATVQCKID